MQRRISRHGVPIYTSSITNPWVPLAAYCYHQTLFGGCYGLLDNSTYMPNPAFYVAVLHTRWMGQAVLNVTVVALGSPKESDVRVYAHCTNRANGKADNGGVHGRRGVVVYLAINPGGGAVGMRLPPPLCDGARVQYALTTTTGLLTSRLVALNGRTLHASAKGELPDMGGAASAGGCADPVLLPAQSASFVVLPDAAHPACS